MINRIVIFLILFFFSSFIFASPPKGGVNGQGFRFGFGPCVGFYKINTNHAQSPSGRMSACVNFKKEIRCDREHKVFFLFGVEYFFHGINFRSYYFDQDTLQLYDKKFVYDYSLFIQEIQVPLQMKFSFNRENNTLFSPYVALGYHLRILLPTNVTVKQDGNQILKTSETMLFRNKVMSDRLNSFVSITAGWQKNTINNSRSGIFIEVSYKQGFSPYYFQSKYAANSLWINSSHLSLQVGLKF
ncbi:MAG: hypothetical protein IPM51_12805 [Sphingobacteriaceae bacterium]|nr:hypothetical protein [Sphingobacteriaceae bacterium]